MAAKRIVLEICRTKQNIHALEQGHMKHKLLLSSLLNIVTFVTSDNSKNDFISGNIHHVDSAVPAWFVVSPVARSPAKLGVTH